VKVNYVGDFSRAILTVLSQPKEKVAYSVFNVGDSSENYTKKMIVDELLKLIPEGRVRCVQKQEDPRDYRVKFDKIRNELGFRISKTVPQAMATILTSIRLGIIDDVSNSHASQKSTPIVEGLRCFPLGTRGAKHACKATSRPAAHAPAPSPRKPQNLRRSWRGYDDVDNQRHYNTPIGK
jgi:hypothetical protein